MSCTQSIAAGPRACGHHLPSVRAEPRRRPAATDSLWRVIALWIARRRQRQELADLDEHLLKDIGLTRAEARHEAAKPFWLD